MTPKNWSIKDQRLFIFFINVTILKRKNQYGLIKTLRGKIRAFLSILWFVFVIDQKVFILLYLVNFFAYLHSWRWCEITALNNCCFKFRWDFHFTTNASTTGTQMRSHVNFYVVPTSDSSTTNRALNQIKTSINVKIINSICLNCS